MHLENYCINSLGPGFDKIRNHPVIKPFLSVTEKPPRVLITRAKKWKNLKAKEKQEIINWANFEDEDSLCEKLKEDLHLDAYRDGVIKSMLCNQTITVECFVLLI